MDLRASLSLVLAFVVFVGAWSFQDHIDRLREWQHRQDEIQRQQDEHLLQHQQALEDRQRLWDELQSQREFEQSDSQLHRGFLLDERQNIADQQVAERDNLRDDLYREHHRMQYDQQLHHQNLQDQRQTEVDQRINEHQYLRDETDREREREHYDQETQREQMTNQRRIDQEREEREKEQEQQRREREREQEERRREVESYHRWRREIKTETVQKIDTPNEKDTPVEKDTPPPVDTPAALDDSSRTTIKSYSGSQLWRVEVDFGEANVEKLDSEGVAQVWYSNSTVWDLLVAPDRQEYVDNVLKEHKLRYTVVIPDLAKAIQEENPPLSEEELTGRKGHRMTWQHYHRATDQHGYLDYIAQTFPDICEVLTIGSSIEGRPLKVVHLKGRPGSPAMWIDGGIHAREWITSASVTYMINELIENRAAYESWLSRVDLYILPLANPDGYEYSHAGDRLWRKNRRRGGGGGQCDGIDLNRNFGYKWGGQGASPQSCQEIYRGAKPFSEPETAAIQQFVLGRKHLLKSYLSFHSYGQYVLYPWGYDRYVPPDHEDLKRVGNKIGQAMQRTSGLPYRVGSSATMLYPASGGSDDWAKGVAGLKYAFTVELRDTGRHGFVLPASHIVSSGKEVVAAVKTLAEEVISLS